MFALNRNLENQETKNAFIQRTPIYGNLMTFDQLRVKIIEGISITNTSILDYQGINWQQIEHISRSQYRRQRMLLYKPHKQFELVQNPRFAPQKRTADQEYFLIDKYLQGLKPQNPHSQLPDTVKAVSRNDIYYLSEEHIKHCSLLKKTVNKFDHNIEELGNINFRPACVAVNESCFVLGGFYGGLYYQDILTGHSVHLPNVTGNLTTSEGDIINQVDILQLDGDNSSSLQLLTAQNDKYVQIFDLEQFRNIPKMRVLCSAQANVAKFSPVNQNVLAVFCDKTDAEIMDARTGAITQTLKGHYDYGLTLAWHPSGNILATGNQDGTTRIWDVRNTASSVHVLPCQMGNSYNVKYSQSGEYLAVLECSDFLNIYCSGNDYQDHQVQEFIGQSTGLAFYEDRIFVGVNINLYHGILQMSQRNSVSRIYEDKMAEYSI